MAVYNNSRYKTAKITLCKTSDGKVKPFIHHRKIFSQDDLGDDVSIIQLTNEFELDFIAYQAYKEEGKWWFLADVNSIIFGLFDANNTTNSYMSVGRELLIPKFLEMKELL